MDDLLLWKQLKSGDKSALERIFRNEANTLCHYGKKFTPDKELIADCIQDLFIELWRTRETIGLTDHIRKYLLVSFRRRLIKELHKENKIQTLDPDLHLKNEVAFSVEKLWVEQEEATKNSEILTAALKKLSSRQQEILYLKYYCELEYNQIIEIMDLNYQSARNLVTRALEAMRKNMMPVLYFLLKMIP
jgi:RNA polymerase sigma factor (sigma-70 family)